MLRFTFPVATRALLAGLGLALAATSARGQAPAAAPTPTSRYPTTSFGLSAGWGAPYGWGVEISTMTGPGLDVNAGAGFNLSGAKLGVGTRYYFTPERRVSAFVGGNLVYSTGLNHVTINTSNQSSSTYGTYYYTNQDYLTVNYKSTTILHLRGGMRWQPTRRFALLAATGYGVALGSNLVEYVDGYDSSTNRAYANLFGPGGFELSVGVAFGLGGR